MATSKHRAIAAAVVALLAAATALAGGRIHQNRGFPLASDVTSQIHVDCTDAVPNADVMSSSTAPIDWMTEFEVKVKARASAGVEAGQVADEIWVDAYARVMADQTLGGLVGGLFPGPVQFEDDEADTSVAVITQRFTVMHRTTNNAIS